MPDKTITIGTRFFRAGVGTVIYNQTGRVALFERATHPTGIWQFQQGGIDINEHFSSTLWRELKEEIDLSESDIKQVDEMPGWTIYEDLYSINNPETNRIGQAHKWYFLELKPETIINLSDATENEVSDFRWVNFSEAINLTNERKKHVYQQLETYFLEFIKPR